MDVMSYKVGAHMLTDSLPEEKTVIPHNVLLY